jgi:hypothetical protein
MAFTLNSVDLTTYGITAGQAPGGNIALTGCFDLPSRIGDTHHVWDDDNTIEPYTAADEIFFGGRDIKFYGHIFGTNIAIFTYLDAFYTAIKAFTGLVTFSTPYGDFSVQVKDIKTKKYTGALSLEITFREPVVTLTGGSLPVAAANAYSIDGIPMSSFGLYVSKPDELLDLPEIKEQYFTKYGAEGYQIVKRKANTLEIDGFMMATSLSNFQTKIKALYLLFSKALTRTVILNYEKTIACFAIDGFKVDSVHLLSGLVVAKFKISLLCVSIWGSTTYEGPEITTTAEVKTALTGGMQGITVTAIFHHSGQSIGSTIEAYCCLIENGVQISNESFTCLNGASTGEIRFADTAIDLNKSYNIYWQMA